MVLYPEVQNQAQAELDQVVGQHRLPMLSDWDNLPYLGAVIKEVLRWHPVTPQGVCLFIPSTHCICCLVRGDRATAPARGGRHPGRVSDPKGHNRRAECLVCGRWPFYLDFSDAYPLLFVLQAVPSRPRYLHPADGVQSEPLPRRDARARPNGLLLRFWEEVRLFLASIYLNA